MELKQYSNYKFVFGVIGILALMGFLRIFYTPPGLDSIGPHSIFDALFTIGLIFLVITLAAAFGIKIIRLLRFIAIADSERWLYAVPLGLGVLAYGVLLLGLVGILSWEAILIWLLIIGVVAFREWVLLLDSVPGFIIGSVRRWSDLSFFQRTICTLLIGITILSLIQCLTPVWDVDGLMYHIQGPRLFLDQGRIEPIEDNWLTYYPFTIEMLFTIGKSVGSDAFAKLIHLTFAILLSIAVLQAGRRFIGDSGAWLALAIFVGIPILPIWASIAYIDIAWAVFEFLAVYAALVWFENRKWQWLVLAGLMMGFGLGSKYLALGGGLVLGSWILWQSRKDGLKAVLANGILFGGIAILVGCPWYLKNMIWTGNPVYPLIFASEGWNADRVTLWRAYMDSFGVGGEILDYLLLPIYLYTKQERFSTFLGSIEIPSPLFLVVFLLPFIKRPKVITQLAWLTAFRFVLWAIGTQQVRYLLPLFPMLSLLSAHVLVDISDRSFWRGRGRLVIWAVTIGMLVSTLLYSILFVFKVKPAGVILGKESRDAFLTRNVSDYSAVKFIKEELPIDARVLMMWDGRGYYCDQRCLPDIDHAQWTILVDGQPDPMIVANQLREDGVTHLLFSVEDADFTLQHDPTGRHLTALNYFTESFKDVCTQEIYRDDFVTLFEMTCP